MAANKRYIARNRDKINRRNRERRRANPEYQMAQWMRSTLHKVLHRQNRRKDAKSVELLGYTQQELKRHIEAQFTKGMSWDLMGSDIHIDHITPVAELIKSGVTDPATINCLSNLRPMWAKENLSKSDRIVALL